MGKHLLHMSKYGFALFMMFASYIQCNGSDILFQHITDMYYNDREKSMGLLLLPKIKLEHIQLTPFSRMRVDLSAQVLQPVNIWRSLRSVL